MNEVLERSSDPGCICYGNWRAIIKEHNHLFNRKYRHVGFKPVPGVGDIYTFMGVLYASDDLYYLMCRPGSTIRLTCVGTIEAQGFELIPRDAGCTCKDGPFTEDGCEAECSGRWCGCTQCNDKWKAGHAWMFTDESI